MTISWMSSSETSLRLVFRGSQRRNLPLAFSMPPFCQEAYASQNHVAMAHARMSPLKALRLKCLECSAGSAQEVLREDFGIEDMGLIGFSADDLAEILPDALLEITGGLTDPDDVPEVPEAPVARPGDVWLLGKHRLLCGDSTVATDVEKVLGGVTPLLMCTDPPYGVEYDPSWRNQAVAAKTMCRKTN